MTRRSRYGWVLPLATMLFIAGVLRFPSSEPVDIPPLPGFLRPPTEAELRARFMAAHPGEKPLNHAIAAAAVRLHEAEPMGRFRLAITAGEKGNDCSDFVAVVIDEGLGVKARFRRDSEKHLLGERWSLYQRIVWRPGVVVLPGDDVSVRHSPWYTPNPDACWHCGIVGTDGMVYDFTKLKRWSTARYGRQSFERFIRHSKAPGQVVLTRLRPEYRYFAKPLPAVD